MTYSFINMLFISTGIFNDKLRPQILSVGTTANAALSCEFELCSWRDVLDTTLCDKVYHWLATGRWFSLGTSVSSANKTDRHDITEILLKVMLNTKPNQPINFEPYMKTNMVGWFFTKFKCVGIFIGLFFCAVLES